MNQNEKRILMVSQILEQFDYQLFSDYNSNGLVSLLFPKRKRAFYFLELYSLSCAALFSELNSMRKMGSASPLKLYYRYLYNIVKLVKFKTFVRKKSLIIVPSKLRKKYLQDIGYSNVVVIKNKPVETTDTTDTTEKNNSLLLAGNLRSLKSFGEFYVNNCSSVKLNVIGVNSSTKSFLNKKFPDVEIQNTIENMKFLKIISSSKFALVSYDGYSTNQILSASSKLFEFFNSSCIPIINNNPGLINECIEESIPYIMYENFNDKISLADFYNKSQYLFSDKKIFSDEISNLKIYLTGLSS